MRIQLPDLEGKALFDYLHENRKKLIDHKKSLPIKSDPIICGTVMVKDSRISVKEKQDEDPNILRVKIVGNTALFADSYTDVLAPDSWKKSLAEHGPNGSDVIYHLKNHDHTDEAIVGDFVSLSTEMIDLSVLGYDASGTAPALVGVSDVKRDYNEKTFNRYKAGKVKQHSIGFQYIRLELAINNKDYKEEFAVWNKHYDKIINKDLVDARGYFWWVSEVKIYEISAVLWGANTLTPTLEIEKMEPEQSTSIADIDPMPGTLTSDQVKTRILLTKFI